LQQPVAVDPKKWPVFKIWLSSSLVLGTISGNARKLVHSGLAQLPATAGCLPVV